MSYIGDYAPSTVIYGKFTTYQPSTGANFALASGVLSVYKDNSVTQSTTGVTLTASFDSVTGLNHFAVDTSADGTFYSAGSNFDIVITTGTVDSVSVVGSVVGSFSINKVAALRPTTAARTLDVATTGEAGIDLANINLAVGAVPAYGIVDNGTAQAATSTTLTLRAAATFADNALTGATILITGGTTGVGETALIVSNVGSTDVATITAWSGAVTPTGTITYVIFGTAAGTGGGASAADVWAYSTRQLTGVQTFSNTGTWTGNVTGSVGSVTGAVGSVTGAVGSVTGNVGGNVIGSVGSVVGAVGSVSGNVAGSVASVVGAVGSVTGNVGGNVLGSVGSVATDGITSASLAASANTEIASAVISAATASPIHANMEQINTVPLVGNGTTTPFTV